MSSDRISRPSPARYNLDSIKILRKLATVSIAQRNDAEKRSALERMGLRVGVTGCHPWACHFYGTPPPPPRILLGGGTGLSCKELGRVCMDVLMHV